MKVEKRSFFAGAAAALAGAAALLLLAACPSAIKTQPEISSFVFESAKNSTLSANAVGIVDNASDLITVRIPNSVAKSAYSSLTPTVVCAAGTSPGTVPTNYSSNPTALTVYQDDGTSRCYMVKVSQAPAQAPADALMFTEYYAGTGYLYRNDYNRWIELTNVSAATIDLSQYSLVFRDREKGIRDESRDMSVSLENLPSSKWDLAAGASLVIYSDRLNTTSYPLSTVTGASSAISDSSLNGIVTCDGDDGFQLVRDGTVLDCIGPNGGTGASFYWGKEKRMLRKNTSKPSAVWDEKNWVSYALDGSTTSNDSDNLGKTTPVFAANDTKLTYFAFEELSPRAYGIIDNTNHTVTLNVEETLDLSAVKISVSTEGDFVYYNGRRVESGVTVADMRSSPVTITVYAADTISSQTYSIIIERYHSLAYTTVNYNFSGNIASLLTALGSGSTGAGTEISGIITAEEIYMTSTFQHCFTIQDKDRGIVVLSNSSLGDQFPLGSYVRLTVSEGSIYYDLPEVKTYSALSRIDKQIHDIYYKTAAYDDPSAVGSVYRWEGTVNEATDSHLVGNFEGNLYFHVASGLKSRLAAGKKGIFYGPVTYSYNVYRMEISDPIQIIEE